MNARMAELVDAHGSGPCVRKDVLVQLQFRALNKGCWLPAYRQAGIPVPSTIKIDAINWQLGVISNCRDTFDC